MSLDVHLKNQLSERKRLNRYRHRSIVESPPGATIRVNGRELVSFCSNDYLGLANHPKVTQAFIQAAHKYGVGSGASHLVCGHSTEHHLLEEELAEFTGRDRVLLFSTGYMANVGVINALLGRKDAIFEDRLNHASLIDAGLSCGAAFQRYRHNDMQQLGSKLGDSQGEGKLIVTDGVFSMDGDCAPLDELAVLAEEHKAWLMVDDAHGFGCMGRTGGGAIEAYGVNQTQVPILMGTLGKAFGGFGAFVAGSEALIEFLIQFARTYVYTTALPPAVAAANRASLRLIVAGEEKRQHLNHLIAQFRMGAESLGLKLWPSSSPIQPIIIGGEQQALKASQDLAELGFWVSAIRPPTVPVGSARLRVTLSALHTEQHVDGLLDALSKVVGRACAEEGQSE